VDLSLTDEDREFQAAARAWFEGHVEPTPRFTSFEEEFEWGRRW
jgi:hypothetical protein